MEKRTRNNRGWAMILLMLAISLQVQAQNLITLKLENKPLPAALKLIEREGGKNVIFSVTETEKHSVSADIRQKTQAEAIGMILQGTPFIYKERADYFAIQKKGARAKAIEIRGIVLDEKNEPLPYCNVLLLASDSTFVNGCVTQADGSFLMLGEEGVPYSLRASYIGYATATQTIGDKNLIQLLPDAQALEEVTVTSSIPTFNMKNGNIVANVSSSILNRETKVIDVLRKMPGMIMQNGELTSYIGGTPLIYVNGKKLHSVDDLKRLEVRNIKHVELITNPGAEYDASVNAVLLITTLNRLEGWSIQLEGDLARNHLWSNEESIKLNYQTGGLNLFGTFTHGDYRRKTHQLMKTIITNPDTIWTQNEDLTSWWKNQMYSYSAGGDYNLNKNHSIGLEYNGYYTNSYAYSHSLSDILANEKEYDRTESLSTLEDNDNYYHHLNGYYSGKFSQKTKLDIYADYAHTHNGRNQTINETSELSGPAQIINLNEADYHVYAVSPKFSYIPNKNQTFTIGGEWSKVTGNNLLSYEGLEDNDASSGTEEEKLAAFLSYHHSMGQFSVNAGLRYENVNFNLHNLYDSSKNIHRSYNNFFPSIGMSYAYGKVAQSLSYRVSTIRPNFERLNNASYYSNKYIRQEGNPELQPEISHFIQYSLNYDFLYLALSYRYKKDFIGTFFYTEENSPNIHVYTWKNFNKQQQLTAIANLRHRFGWYEPSLTGMFQKNIMKVESMGEQIPIDRPLWYLTFENNIHLPKNWLVNMEYLYKSKGVSQWFTFREEHNMNVNISKTLLHNTLQVKLAGEHLLNRRMSLYDGRINNIYFWQHEDQDLRKISLSLVYRFNNYSKKYKGQSAADDVLKRL